MYQSFGLRLKRRLDNYIIPNVLCTLDALLFLIRYKLKKNHELLICRKSLDKLELTFSDLASVYALRGSDYFVGQCVNFKINITLFTTFATYPCDLGDS